MRCGPILNYPLMVGSKIDMPRAQLRLLMHTSARSKRSPLRLRKCNSGVGDGPLVQY